MERAEAGGELAKARDALELALVLRVQYSVMESRLERLGTELNPDAAATANRLRNLKQQEVEYADYDLGKIREKIETEEENLKGFKNELEELMVDAAAKAAEISEQMEVVNGFEKKEWWEARGRDFSGRLKSDHLDLYDLRWRIFEDIFKKALRESRGKLTIRDGFVLGWKEMGEENLWLTEEVYSHNNDWVTMYQGELSLVEALFFRPAWNEDPVGVFKRLGFSGRVELQGRIDGNGIYKRAILV